MSPLLLLLVSIPSILSCTHPASFWPEVQKLVNEMSLE
jgi:beta-glucosidase